MSAEDWTEGLDDHCGYCGADMAVDDKGEECRQCGAVCCRMCSSWHKQWHRENGDEEGVGVGELPF